MCSEPRKALSQLRGSWSAKIHGRAKRRFPIAWTRKLEPASDRGTISVVITPFAVGPTRVVHPSELHRLAHIKYFLGLAPTGIGCSCQKRRAGRRRKAGQAKRESVLSFA